MRGVRGLTWCGSGVLLVSLGHGPTYTVKGTEKLPLFPSQQPLTKSTSMWRKREPCFPSAPLRPVMAVVYMCLLELPVGMSLSLCPHEATESWWQMSLPLLPSVPPPPALLKHLTDGADPVLTPPHRTPRNWAAKNIGKLLSAWKGTELLSPLQVSSSRGGVGKSPVRWLWRPLLLISAISVDTMTSIASECVGDLCAFAWRWRGCGGQATWA